MFWLNTQCIAFNTVIVKNFPVLLTKPQMKCVFLLFCRESCKDKFTFMILANDSKYCLKIRPTFLPFFPGYSKVVKCMRPKFSKREVYIYLAERYTSSFKFTARSKIGSQLLLPSTSSNLLLQRGSANV